MANRHLIPAVVVGGNLNSLGVVRSLRRGGVSVYVLAPSRACPAAWSRHARYVRAATLEGRALVEALLRLAAEFDERPVLILTGDDHVAAVSAYREEIAARYRISLPDADVVDTLADKALFQALAEREGFPVPKSLVLSGPGELQRLPQLTPPLVLKPADKTLVLRGLAERAVLAPTLAEAAQVAADMLGRVPRVIVQEYVAGADTDIYFTLFTCDRKGTLLALFPGRKLVCVPPVVGGTAVCVAAPEFADELAAISRDFVARVGYRGIGSLEFKRDAARGGFYIIEPTVGRTDWQEEIATLCGVNVPLATWRSEVGLPAEAQPDHYLQYAWRSSAAFSAPLNAGTRMVDGLFRWTDPLPALWEYGIEGRVLPLWRRASRALRRRD